MNKSSNQNQILNEIEAIRSSNNSNWMRIIRIALKHDKEETIKLLKNIVEMDGRIKSEMEKLINE